MNLPLQGKRAVVGGASQGIGQGCAEALAGGGATIVALSRRQGALDDVVAALPRPDGQEHLAVAVDFADTDAVAAAAASIVDAGTVDILVNNTGGPAPGALRATETDDLEAAFAMHVLAYQKLVAAVQPGMIEAGYGRIINVISTSVASPIPGLGVSNTIRAAVANWARTLAVELGGFGITVNNVLPGYIDTDRLRTSNQRRAELAGATVDEMAAAQVASIPVGRLGTPSDIGSAVAFLASPAAGYINGVDLPVDGGRLVSLNR